MRRVTFWSINSNNQFVKVEFNYNSCLKSWLAFIVCSNSKRKCNDGLHKSKKSPKNLLGKRTGKHHSNNMNIFLEKIKQFDEIIPKYNLRVTPCNKYLTDKYNFLLDSGFKLEYNDKNINGYYEKMKEV